MGGDTWSGGGALNQTGDKLEHVDNREAQDILETVNQLETSGNILEIVDSAEPGTISQGNSNKHREFESLQNQDDADDLIIQDPWHFDL